MQSLPEKAVAVTTVLVTHPKKVKQYEWNINISPNFMDDFVGGVALGPYTFSGSEPLSNKEKCSVSGSIYKYATCKLRINFSLPPPDDGTEFQMKPFTIDFLKDEKVLKSKPELELKHQATVGEHLQFFSEYMDLSDYWTPDMEVDNIRMTFFIEVRKRSSAALLENISSHPLGDLKTTTGPLLRSKYLSDFVVCCEDQEIPAHRFVLSMVSSVFQTMFESDTLENKDGRLIIRDMTKKSVESLLQWMYTGEVDVSDVTEIIDLFKAAHKYCMDPLKNWCVSQIAAKYINLEYALEIFGLGQLYGEKALLERAKDFIKAEKREIFKDLGVYNGFMELYPDFMRELIME